MGEDAFGHESRAGDQGAAGLPRHGRLIARGRPRLRFRELAERHTHGHELVPRQSRSGLDLCSRPFSNGSDGHGQCGTLGIWMRMAPEYR